MTVVSGLPRSGTSLMMQMLEAAGLELAIDQSRVADRHNPNGFFELDAVRRLREDASFLESIVGKAVKVVVPLVMSLPQEYDYRVILMERDLGEVLASQRAMLDLAGADPVSDSDDQALARAFRHEQEKLNVWLAEQKNIRSCRVSHQRAICSPMEVSELVYEFLCETGAVERHGAGSDFQARTRNRMARIVDPRLHHQRE
jgi:hypothetical protein